MVFSQAYYDATFTAARLLRESGLDAYPLSPVRLARSGGIKVFRYEQFATLTGGTVQELLCHSQDGFSTQIDGQYVIAYNPEVASRGRRRWTLIHEFAHISLGHVHAERFAALAAADEEEADRLTSCLIAPLPLAFLCRVNDEEEFAACFGLSNQAASYCYQDYIQYLRLDVFPEMGYGSVLPAFQPFILHYLWTKEKAKRCPSRRLDIFHDG